MSDMETIEAEAREEMGEISNLPAIRASEAIIARGEITVEEVVAQRDKVIAVMAAVMKEGVHYGKIPGVPKPSLLKPGAESINVALRLAPHYESEKIWHDDGHLTVSARCTLKHIPTDLTIATGEGLCTTREQKYAYRNQKRACPVCGAEAIIKGKAEYGGGWICWKKEDGCGAKFPEGDAAIESQEVGKIPNPELADSYNTVLKMADKRALIAAVLNGTAASDVFTQDVEDAVVTPEMPRDGTASVIREEGPGPVIKPRSWTALQELVAGWDEQTNNWFWQFSAAARKLLYGVEDSKELTPAQKKELLDISATAAVALRKEFSGDAMPPPALEDLRRAFAQALEGQELAIPADSE